MKNKEVRFFKADEFRMVKAEDGSGVLEGYSAVFNKESEDFGWGDWEVREVIKPGAFANALKKSDCRALWNHDSNHVLGRESSKTLTITEDETGIRSIISLPDTSTARDLAVLVERGDVREQSFGFTVVKDAWEDDKEKRRSVRTIIEIGELYDISPVTFAAYPDTTVAKRSFEQFRASNANIESDRIEDPANRADKIDTEIIELLFEEN